jgi:hypothetical protein
MPSDSFTFDGRVPALLAADRLNFSNYKIVRTLYFRAGATLACCILRRVVWSLALYLQHHTDVDCNAVCWCCATVAPRFRPGNVMVRTVLVNPCHPQCDVCYGFSKYECSACSLGYFLYEGTTCGEPTECGRGQVRRCSLAVLVSRVSVSRSSHNLVTCPCECRTA